MAPSSLQPACPEQIRTHGLGSLLVSDCQDLRELAITNVKNSDISNRKNPTQAGWAGNEKTSIQEPGLNARRMVDQDKKGDTDKSVPPPSG